MLQSSPSASCTREVSAAAAWWKRQLSLPQQGPAASLSRELLDGFETTLFALLNERIQGHWHPKEPIKGQAHRSVSLHIHGRPDPLLLKASQAAKVRNLFDFFSKDVHDVTMFIDPGEVAVQIGRSYCKEIEETIVWSDPLIKAQQQHERAHSAPSKPISNISSNVKSTPPSNSSATPSKRSPSTTPPRRASGDRYHHVVVPPQLLQHAQHSPPSSPERTSPLHFHQPIMPSNYSNNGPKAYLAAPPAFFAYTNTLNGAYVANDVRS